MLCVQGLEVGVKGRGTGLHRGGEALGKLVGRFVAWLHERSAQGIASRCQGVTRNPSRFQGVT